MMELLVLSRPMPRCRPGRPAVLGVEGVAFRQGPVCRLLDVAGRGHVRLAELEPEHSVHGEGHIGQLTNLGGLHLEHAGSQANVARRTVRCPHIPEASLLRQHADVGQTDPRWIDTASRLVQASDHSKMELLQRIPFLLEGGPPLPRHPLPGGLDPAPRRPASRRRVRRIAADLRARFPTPRSVRESAPMMELHSIFRKAGVNPRKLQPACERLVQLVLKRGAIPTINNLVDTYNLVSLKWNCSLGAHDLDRLAPPVRAPVPERRRDLSCPWEAGSRNPSDPANSATWTPGIA